MNVKDKRLRKKVFKKIYWIEAEKKEMEKMELKPKKNKIKPMTKRKGKLKKKKNVPWIDEYSSWGGEGGGRGGLDEGEEGRRDPGLPLTPPTTLYNNNLIYFMYITSTLYYVHNLWCLFLM